MPRPRIDGFDEKVIEGFIERGIYRNQKEVVSAALRLLAEHHLALSAKKDAEFDESVYAAQLDSEGKRENATMGNLARRSKVRTK